MPQNPETKFHLSDLLWDGWCLASLIGIWPRFIEPALLLTTHQSAVIPGLPEALQGVKIVQFSDLHLQKSLSERYLNRLVKKINGLKPDIVVFTGDFLCYSQFDQNDEMRLLHFLNQFKAPHGCYAILGNHDYAKYVSINSKGEYDLLENEARRSLITKGFERLFTTTVLAKKTTARAQAVELNPKLVELLQKSPFKLLENETLQVEIGHQRINICGLGEYTLGKTNPEKAFDRYDKKAPGIILLHNPDGIPLLEGYPGEIILCGHTHGGQVNLPWMWKKFTLLENSQFKRGVIDNPKRFIYVNRGIGSVFRFRWFAPPEILALTLQAP